MSTGMVSLDDIIEDVIKNIKSVFQSEVKSENQQEAYIIGLKLTLDRLAQESELAQKEDSDPEGEHSSPPESEMENDEISGIINNISQPNCEIRAFIE
ncbi:3156_t:CDS:2 [Ambispora gerdemannii]|uniref:3156_t:CDS:1 n=1 Tax=Ambispora gerdemannii TaxID=144530 RepID=A0A9N9E5P0_9GLOM|nr:3156_t:CDS:2 [Ambispora gerdemannii]